MPISIVCYSHTGNNLQLAEHLAERLQCGIARITEKTRRGWLKTLLDLAFRRSPAILPLHVQLAAYRHVVLVSPVWASRVASPLRSFLAQYAGQLGDYSFITLCGYARPEQHRRLTEELTRLVGHPPRAVCELSVAERPRRLPGRDDGEGKPDRVSEDDMSEYGERITAFLDEADLRSTPPSRAASGRCA